MNSKRALLGATAIFAILCVTDVTAHSGPVRVDAGKFHIALQENEVGVTTFATDKDGSSTYDENVTIAGRKFAGHIVVKAKNGMATQVDADFKPGGKLRLVLAGAQSQLTVVSPAQPNHSSTRTVQLGPHPYLFDNFAPHLLSALVGSYDVRKGGTQDVQLVIVNAGAPVAATLTRGATKTRVVNSVPLAITTYTLSIGGKVDIKILADSTNRILMWNVPAQKYKVVREGYSALAKLAISADPRLSKPMYQVKSEEKAMVKMRDGARLPADVYRPDALRGDPAIMRGTLYGRKKAVGAASYAKRGYVFVAQHGRGKLDSGGNGSRS